MGYVRRASPRVKFNGKNVTVDLAAYLKLIEYDDPAEGESDTVSIELHNIGMRWLKAWAPVKGDKVEAGALFRGFSGGKTAVNFGTFILDSVKYKGGPISLTIGAISQPITSGFASTKQSIQWKNVQLREICQKICDKYKLTLIFEAQDIPIQAIEQSQEADADFMKKLAEKFSLKLKVFNNKVILYDVATYEKRGAVATLTRGSFIDDNWEYDSELDGVYEACEISYSNPSNNQDIKVRVGKPPSYKSEAGFSAADPHTGTAGQDTVRCIYINDKCDTEQEARQKALAALNDANRGITTLSGDITLNTSIFATSVVNVKGMGVIDGKYYVKRMKLFIDPDRGSYQHIETYKIYPQVTDQPAAQQNAAATVGAVVNFKGGTHYVSSYKGSKGYTAKAGPATITSINAGQAHPYHLIHKDSSSNVYGWVDEGTF